MKLEVTDYNIQIPLTHSQWDRLDDIDKDDDETLYNEMWTRLKNWGCYDTDFHGMLGRFIYFKIDKMDYRKNKSSIIEYLENLLGE